MEFFCPIGKCDGRFTLKHNLIRHVKNQHGNLWSCQRCKQTFNRYDNYEYHQRTCLFKTSGKRSAEHLENSKKKLKDGVNYVGGALENTLVDYRINLEDEKQNPDKILDVLKDTVFLSDLSFMLP